MKKLLGIVVLGLLFFNNANSQVLIDKAYFIGMTKKQFEKTPKKNYRNCFKIGYHNITNPILTFNYSCTEKKVIRHDSFPEYKTEIIHYSIKSLEVSSEVYVVFENVNQSSIKKQKKLLGDGILKLVTLDLNEAKITADPVFAKKIEDAKKRKEEEKRIAEKKKKDSRDAIDLAATLYYWGLETNEFGLFFYGERNKNNLKGHMRIFDENFLPWHTYFGISTKDYNKFDITAKTISGSTIEFTSEKSDKKKIYLNFKKMSATLIDSNGKKSKLKLKKPEKLFAAKTFDPEKPEDEKPKKKKPKYQTPGDDSIIAAASGTGFFVSRAGHVITNYHVIEGCDANKLTFKGKEIKADTLAVDKMNDLAILKANLRPSKVYPVATEDAALLEDIIIAGYPLGKKVSAAIKTSKGSVTALAGYGDNFSEFQTDAALNQGNSGGPIMNQKGNVVGVAVANYGKKEGVESFNFGIKSSTLRTFANANGLKFISPNRRDLSNKDLGELITSGTVYLECFMTVAKIKRMLAEAENRKAFFTEPQ